MKSLHACIDYKLLSSGGSPLATENLRARIGQQARMSRGSAKLGITTQ
jgi:hypothetical protein